MNALWPKAAPSTTVSLTYTKPGSTQLVRSTMSSSTGTFQDTLVPGTPGVWSVQASWPGDADHLPATTSRVTFVVIGAVDSLFGGSPGCPPAFALKDADINGDGISDWLLGGISDDAGNVIELWCVDPVSEILPLPPFDEFYALIVRNPAGAVQFVGKCPFGAGQNTGWVMHSGDINPRNGSPDQFAKVFWRSEDGGNDDPTRCSAPGRDAWEYEFEVDPTLTIRHMAQDGSVLQTISRAAPTWPPGGFDSLEPQCTEWTEGPMLVGGAANSINFDPDTLNRRSQGAAVTVYIELPRGLDVARIGISTVRLNGIVPALSRPAEVGDHDSDGRPDLMVKFDRQQVIDLFRGLPVPAEYEVRLTGEIDKILFTGTARIRVIEQPTTATSTPTNTLTVTRTATASATPTP